LMQGGWKGAFAGWWLLSHALLGSPSTLTEEPRQDWADGQPVDTVIEVNPDEERD
jgi:hypothetical protein